ATNTAWGGTGTAGVPCCWPGWALASYCPACPGSSGASTDAVATPLLPVLLGQLALDGPDVDARAVDTEPRDAPGFDGERPARGHALVGRLGDGAAERAGPRHQVSVTTADA